MHDDTDNQDIDEDDIQEMPEAQAIFESVDPQLVEDKIEKFEDQQ